MGGIEVPMNPVIYIPKMKIIVFVRRVNCTKEG